MEVEIFNTEQKFFRIHAVIRKGRLKSPFFRDVVAIDRWDAMETVMKDCKSKLPVENIVSCKEFGTFDWTKEDILWSENCKEVA